MIKKPDENTAMVPNLDEAKILVLNIMRGGLRAYIQECAAANDPNDMRPVDAMLKAATNPDRDTNDFDMLVLMAAQLLRDGDHLPPELACFAADALEGKAKRPTKRGQDKYENFDRDSSLYRAVVEVVNKCDLPAYSSNELSAKYTAANLVSEVTGYSIEVVTKAYKWGLNNRRNSAPR